MKRYAVAVANLFDNTNKIHIVEATNPIEAICNATGDPIDEFDGATLEEVINTYFDGDMLVSEPVEI